MRVRFLLARENGLRLSAEAVKLVRCKIGPNLKRIFLFLLQQLLRSFDNRRRLQQVIIDPSKLDDITRIHSTVGKGNW